MADIAASVLAKLKNKAKASGISYQQCLQLFFQEEFLRRLAGSKYTDNFVLKGGLFIYTLTNFESRATVDVDFLMRGLNNDLARMDEIIAEILSVDTGNDFVTFKATKMEPIAVQRKYHGISTQITGYIKNIRVPFNVDIGVGDVIVPSAQRRNIQTQLDGYEKPEILTYSLESTIAEKFDAILQRFELTGRMKDFYDIYYLSRTFDFDGLKLQTAIQETLQNRGTAYEKDSFDRVLSLAEDEDMQVKWRYFLKTLGNPDMAFADVMEGIKTFLLPVVINCCDLGSIFFGQFNIFLFVRTAHLTQIHKENFFFSVAVAFQLTVLFHNTSFLILVQNPKRNADVRRDEKFTRENDDGFNLVVSYEFLSDNLSVTVIKSSIGNNSI